MSQAMGQHNIALMKRSLLALERNSIESVEERRKEALAEVHHRRKLAETALGKMYDYLAIRNAKTLRCRCAVRHKYYHVLRSCLHKWKSVGHIWRHISSWTGFRIEG